MSIDALVGQLLGDMRTVAEDVLRREGVRLRTATVTAVDPLAIRYDGETTASVVSPRSTVLAVTGDRVVVAKSRGQATVLGVLAQRSEWDPIALPAEYTGPGHGFPLSIQRDGSRRYLRGRIARVDGANIPAGSTTLLTLEPRDRPRQATGGFVQVSGFASPGFGRFEVTGDGVVSVGLSKITAWIGFDSITWDVA